MKNIRKDSVFGINKAVLSLILTVVTFGSFGNDHDNHGVENDVKREIEGEKHQH